MASNAKYDGDKIDYGAVYYSIQTDPAIRPAFDTKGKVKKDAGGVPIIADTLILVKVGTFRPPSGKADRPVFQCDQLYVYGERELDFFRGQTSALDIKTVETNGKPAAVTAAVAGF